MNQLEANLESRILTSSQEKHEAKVLLHNCYVNDQHWTPDPKNPSDFRISTVNGVNTLIDKFEHRSRWIGVYSEGKIVACCRILLPDSSGLEFNLYSKTHIPNLQSHIELNRFAIQAGLENTIALPLLVKTAISFCLTLGTEKILTTMSFPYPAQFATKIGFKEIEKSNFKYSQHDSREVSIFTFDLSSAPDVAKFFNIFDSLLAA